MPESRDKAVPMAGLAKLSVAQHAALRAAGAAGGQFWDAPPDALKADVVAFKHETKEYYYFHQRRRCTYCSIELAAHQRSFDAEHVLDKDTHPGFMFELGNLCIACKRCNTTKGKQVVLSAAGLPAVLPTASGDYLMVHPHLDEWGTHLEFDSLGRIVAIAANPKGIYTIKLCGINALNAARLSDAFAPDGRLAAQNALEGFFRVTKAGWKRRYLNLLNALAEHANLAPAKALVAHLRTEVP